LGSSGTVVGAGASALFFAVQWIFAILEPSGNGLPLPGAPARDREARGSPRLAGPCLCQPHRRVTPGRPAWLAPSCSLYRPMPRRARVRRPARRCAVVTTGA
jgi:hypothetical protein